MMGKLLPFKRPKPRKPRKSRTAKEDVHEVILPPSSSFVSVWSHWSPGRPKVLGALFRLMDREGDRWVFVPRDKMMRAVRSMEKRDMMCRKEAWSRRDAAKRKKVKG